MAWPLLVSPHLSWVPTMLPETVRAHQVLPFALSGIHIYNGQPLRSYSILFRVEGNPATDDRQDTHNTSYSCAPSSHLGADPWYNNLFNINHLKSYNIHSIFLNFFYLPATDTQWIISFLFGRLATILRCGRSIPLLFLISRLARPTRCTYLRSHAGSSS